MRSRLAQGGSFIPRCRNFIAMCRLDPLAVLIDVSEGNAPFIGGIAYAIRHEDHGKSAIHDRARIDATCLSNL